CQQYNDSPFTF
nr:immunoglobulin light chain junction region [Macaca mulatta]